MSFMQQFSEFLGNHMLLAGALLAILVALIANELVLIRRGGRRLAPSDAVRLINDKDALIVDLRAATDYKRGHIVDSRNIPMAKLDDEIKSLRKHQRSGERRVRTGLHDNGATCRVPEREQSKTE